MADVEKRADLCDSAVFGDDGTGMFAFISCAAWMDIGKIDHRALGITRTSTDAIEYPFGCDEVESMVESIGQRCANLCSACPRFTSKQVPIETAEVEGFLTGTAGA